MAAKKPSRMGRSERHTKAVEVTLPEQDLRELELVIERTGATRSRVVSAAIRLLAMLSPKLADALVAEVERPYGATKKTKTS